MSRPLVDQAARDYAVDPSQNVVLEASAGTGKTRVLVERYVNLLRAGIDPDHILAITFTRKAAAEMRERIVERLREAARLSELDAARWRELKDHLGDIAISTIDAFCLSLLREYPLEADIDPGFDLADETQTPRLVQETLDRALRICRALAAGNEDVALVFAQLGERRLRVGLAALLQRRLVAPRALGRFLQRGAKDLTAAFACRRAAERLSAALTAVPCGLERFLADGPATQPAFALLASDIMELVRASAPAEEGVDGSSPFDTRDGRAHFRSLVDRLRGYFLTQEGRPRGREFAGTGFKATDCGTPDAWKRHRRAAGDLAPVVAEAIRAFRRDLNIVMSRGIWRIYAVVAQQYQQTLDSHALVDFSGVLERAVRLLKNLDEFAESRYRLEARYQHVLVDEFQDTSRAQWELIAELVRTWGEGFGTAAGALPPSIFIVGDRKQSIYAFRDAEAAVLDDAAAFVTRLRPSGDPRRAISFSFRAAPPLLAFVNDLFETMVRDQPDNRRDSFRYGRDDRFPIETPADGANGGEALGLIVGDTIPTAADRVAAEISRLLTDDTVRDRITGVRRRARAGDVAVLFRSRDAHRDFEKAIARRGIATYVYKGLGFFEADEVQDLVAVLKFLANPLSNMRAAALVRSRFVRLSDAGIAVLGPDIADAVADPAWRLGDLLDAEDRQVLVTLRESVGRWLALVDRIPPSELLTLILVESAYAFEMRGGGHRQARENVKKLCALVRRFQNRGYATMARVADHLEELAASDESNATVDALDAVSLMTVHAAKGLEFPVVFVVNIGRGVSTARAPVRVAADGDGEPSVAIADFQSEADEDTLRREREETKRLLYVALTRARDRLYLSAVVPDGRCRMGHGSLGEVFPDAVKQLFNDASRESGGVVEWVAESGARHQFRVSPPAVLPTDA